jgi:hypothetical protein
VARAKGCSHFGGIVDKFSLAGVVEGRASGPKKGVVLVQDLPKQMADHAWSGIQPIPPSIPRLPPGGVATLFRKSPLRSVVRSAEIMNVARGYTTRAHHLMPEMKCAAMHTKRMPSHTIRVHALRFRMGRSSCWQRRMKRTQRQSWKNIKY